MKQVHLKIYGDVQGVGFRFFVRQQAKLLCLKGFVKNERDFVDVVAQGLDFRVDDFVHKCRRGPIMSSVKKVEVEDEPLSEFEDFEIRL
jgi:acylphosphatase